MQAVIIFDMPQDEHLLQEYMQAPAWQAAATTFDEWLRSKIKYQENSTTMQAMYEQVLDKFRDSLIAEGLVLD